MVADEVGHLRIPRRSLNLTRLSCCTNTVKYWSLDLLHVHTSPSGRACQIPWQITSITEYRASHCYSRFIMQRLDTRIQDLEKETDFPVATHLYGRAQFTVSTQTELHPAQKERPLPRPSQRVAVEASKAVSISSSTSQSRLISVRSQVQLLRNLRWVSSGFNLNLGGFPGWLSSKEYPC